MYHPFWLFSFRLWLNHAPLLPRISASVLLNGHTRPLRVVTSTFGGDYLGRRTNTAVWLEKHGRWQVNVQKDGVRRSFYSSTPGRTGQRECNAKADAWLDDNISGDGKRVSVLFYDYIEDLKSRTCYGHCEMKNHAGASGFYLR